MRITSLTLAALLAATAARAATVPTPPPTRTDTVVDTLHGVAVPDPYRWLEDKDAPETRAWIATQQQYEHTVLDPVAGRETLRTRLAALMRRDVATAPYARGGRYFYTRRAAEQDLSVLTMREHGRDEVLVDPHGWSKDHTVSTNWEDVSLDGRLAAYNRRVGGQDETAILFMDVDRRALVDSLPYTRYFSVAITPDRKAAVYSIMTPQGPRVLRHALGSSTADTPVFGDKYGPGDIIGVGLASGGEWMIYTVYHGSSADDNELWLQRSNGEGAPLAIVNDVHAGFFGDVAGRQLVMRTNWKAPNGRFMLVDLAHPAREHWREIVPQASDAVVQDFALAGGRLLVTYLRNVNSYVQVYDLAGHAKQAIRFPALGTVGSLSGLWNQPEAFMTFQSYLIPQTIYRWDAATATRTVWWQSKVPFDPSAYTVDQAWYKSKDGTRVPMFLVHKRGLTANGARPTMLTGYGGFDVSETPYFSPEAVVWVEQGGVWAEPSLRGGGEFGERWHQAGMLEKKQNVFDDFNSAALWLIANKWTSPSRLAIEGGSNGGLLVGAAMTQHPELYRAVACHVPLLDMLRYHKFLVARFWIPEYGSSDDAKQFQWLHAYSPYQHVQKGAAYPAVMFISGDSDTRVDPLHARKMTALMQASTGSDRPVVLHYDTTSGHSGGKPVSKQIEDTADTLHFLFWQLGVTPGDGRAAR